MNLNITGEVPNIDDVYQLTSVLLQDNENSLDNLLKASCKLFNAELGVICLLKDNKYLVQGVHSSLPYEVDFGQVTNLADTFCYHATQRGEVLALPDVANSEYSHLPCCQVLKAKSYIGIPLVLDNKEVGTINFSSREVRPDGYSQAELNLLAYLNQWVSQHLNRAYYKETLHKNNLELNAKNKALQTLIEENNQLMQILVHDLKSPLSNIKMLSYLFQDFARDKDSEELISIFNKSLDYVFHLIEQMETLNNMETFSTNNYVEEFNIVDFIRANLKDFTNAAESKAIKLNFEADVQKPVINTDMNFLKRIMYNLISNAIKFSPFEKQIAVKVHQTIDGFDISIADEGPGISDGEFSKLFQKFAKLNNRPTNSESSSGLGLFIVKELLKKINGDIKVESQVNNGSTFTISLPFSVEA